MKVFYHSSDLDGQCSGAIVKYYNPKCELFPINYGQEFPWDKINKKEVIYMVDFTLQPFDQMIKLSSMCDLIWIDHHNTELIESEKRKFNPKGYRKNGIAACALTWLYCSKKKIDDDNFPIAIKYLAMYDIWDHSDPNTLPFQYGLRLKNTFPDQQQLWSKLFDIKDNKDYHIQHIIGNGEIVLEYETQNNAKFAKSYVYETELNGYKAIICNKGFTNSKVFDSVWDDNKYDIMITYCRKQFKSGNKWLVTLYSTKDNVDVGLIARKYNGGGHKNAAGFETDVLPFEY